MTSTPSPVGELRGADLWAVLVLAFFLAALGLYPHLRFSLSVGELSFFKGAYDEDTYFNLMRSGIVFRSDRTLSVYALKALYGLTGGSPNGTFIAADLMFPALAGVAAYGLAAQLAGAWPLRLALTLALLIVADVLSFANIAIWTQWNGLAALRWLLGTWGPVLVPCPDVAYLEIYRTPEPQVSYVATFIAWALLIRIARQMDGMAKGEIVALAAINVVLPWAYLFTTLPTLALQAWLGLALWRRHRAPALTLLILTAASGAATAAAVITGGSGAEGNLFHSHLPIVTPATLMSVASMAMIGGAILRRRQSDLTLWLALGFVALPFIMANQQIVTGVMPTAREWERYVSYQLLVAGLALAAPAFIVTTGIRGAQIARYGGGFVTLMLVALIVRAQALTYRYFEPLNVATLATLRALNNAGGAPADTRVLLDDVNLVPHLTARLPLPRPRFVIDYTANFLGPAPKMDPSGNAPESPNAQSLFEYWWRTGMSAQDAEAVLRQEASARSGFFSAFVFNMHDFLGVMTDNRAVRPDDIARNIPVVIDRYRAYQASARQKADPSPVIVLTVRAPSAVRASAGLENRLLGSGTAGATTIYAYRQTPAP